MAARELQTRGHESDRSTQATTPKRRSSVCKIEAGEPELLKDLASALSGAHGHRTRILLPRGTEAAEDEILEAFEEHSIAEVALKRALATDPDDESFDAE